MPSSRILHAKQSQAWRCGRPARHAQRTSGVTRASSAQSASTPAPAPALREAIDADNISTKATMKMEENAGTAPGVTDDLRAQAAGEEVDGFVQKFADWISQKLAKAIDDLDDFSQDLPVHYKLSNGKGLETAMYLDRQSLKDKTPEELLLLLKQVAHFDTSTPIKVTAIFSKSPKEATAMPSCIVAADGMTLGRRGRTVAFSVERALWWKMEIMEKHHP